MNTQSPIVLYDDGEPGFETYCHRCGGVNVLWWSPQWSVTVSPQHTVLCVTCFVRAYVEKNGMLPILRVEVVDEKETR